MALFVVSRASAHRCRLSSNVSCLIKVSLLLGVINRQCLRD